MCVCVCVCVSIVRDCEDEMDSAMVGQEQRRFIEKFKGERLKIRLG